MAPTNPSRQVLHDLVASAVRAPSSHNTQPWRFVLGDDHVSVFADRSRRLPVNDPADRELIISCGTAAFNLQVAARHAGWLPTVERRPDDQNPDLLYRITLLAVDAAPGDEDLAPSIETRHTTRAGFTHDALSPGLIDSMTAAAAEHGAWLEVVDEARRDTVAELVGEGARTQFADPQWRRELASWMHPSSSGDGLAAPALVGPIVRTIVRHVDLGARTGRSDHDLAMAAPVLAVLGTPGDGVGDWLVAGEALQRVLLVAAGEGVQAGYLNQPCQVGELRPRLRQSCDNDGHPQTVLRLGHPVEALSPAPRRPVDAVVEPA